MLTRPSRVRGCLASAHTVRFQTRHIDALRRESELPPNGHDTMLTFAWLPQTAPGGHVRRRHVRRTDPTGRLMGDGYRVVGE